MPEAEVVNEQKTLHIGVLIGWGCLIYNHRYFSVIRANNDPEESYKELLGCLNVLLCSAGYQAEYREIEILFQNYFTDEQLQKKVQTLLQYLESKPNEKVNEWFKAFSEREISNDTLQEIAISEIAIIIHAGYLWLKFFEHTLNFKKYSMLFTEALEREIKIFLDFDIFWSFPLNFLVAGFNFFVQRAAELTTLQQDAANSFCCNEGVLIIDLQAIAANANNFAVLQEVVAGIDAPICVNICNIDIFDRQQRKILCQLKKLLQLCQITELPNFPQGGFCFQEGILLIDLQAIAEDANTCAALQQQIDAIANSISVNVCNINIFNPQQRKTLAELKKILLAVPYRIYEFNVYLSVEQQKTFNIFIASPDEMDAEDFIKHELLKKLFLLQLLHMHAQILSVPNIQTNNFDKNYWRHLTCSWDVVFANNWLLDLHRHLAEQSRIIQQEEKTYNILRNQILGWDSVSRTVKAPMNANAAWGHALTMARTDRTVAEKTKHRQVKVLQ